MPTSFRPTTTVRPTTCGRSSTRCSAWWRRHGGGNDVAGAVIEATGIRRGEAMTGVHEGTVAAHVQRLPWVRTATVSRHWPGTVSISVTERRPVASVRGRGDEWALVD